MRQLNFLNTPKKKVEILADRETLSLKPRQSKNYLLNRISKSLILHISAATILSSRDVNFKVSNKYLTYKYRSEQYFQREV